VFTEKSIEDCLNEIEFDPNNVINIKHFDDYIESTKLLGDPEFMSPIVLSGIMHDHYNEVHEQILKGECFEVKYKPRLTLNFFIDDIYFLLDKAYMFLKNPQYRTDHRGFSFFSELFTNIIEWGNNSKNDKFEFHVRTSPKGSLIVINQENEWDYKKVVKIFQEGGSITSREGSGGCGMWCMNRNPYEVGYTDNGKKTYVIITKDTFDKSSKS